MTPAAMLEGVQLVGSRVRVWWGGDKKWYRGRVTKYDAALLVHFVSYDDGDKKWHDLNNATEDWELLPSTAAKALIRPQQVASATATAPAGRSGRSLQPSVRLRDQEPPENPPKKRRRPSTFDGCEAGPRARPSPFNPPRDAHPTSEAESSLRATSPATIVAPEAALCKHILLHVHHVLHKRGDRHGRMRHVRHPSGWGNG